MFVITNCEPALKEAVLRTGDRKSIWEYENANGHEVEKTMRPEKIQEIDLQAGARRGEQELEQMQRMIDLAMAQQAQINKDVSYEYER
jgi:anion-transporting  ArsA/GET3 family ATPase